MLTRDKRGARNVSPNSKDLTPTTPTPPPPPLAIVRQSAGRPWDKATFEVTERGHGSEEEERERASERVVL